MCDLFIVTAEWSVLYPGPVTGFAIELNFDQVKCFSNVVFLFSVFNLVIWGF